MKIAVVNLSSIPVAYVRAVIASVNRQILQDFAPAWSTFGRLMLVDRSMVGAADAVIYLAQNADEDNILGYHAMDAAGLPYGYVFVDLASALNEPWSVTLSHEALELLADSTTNGLAAGPHPHEARTVFHWWEMCDAVQAQQYHEDDGIVVSNFVLPHYFTPGEELGRPTNFLNRRLKSFGIAPGGYVGFFDPKLGQHTAVFADDAGRARFEAKHGHKGAATRRGTRYQNS
jgi:hypothetical protein